MSSPANLVALTIATLFRAVVRAEPGAVWGAAQIAAVLESALLALAKHNDVLSNNPSPIDSIAKGSLAGVPGRADPDAE